MRDAHSGVHMTSVQSAAKTASGMSPSRAISLCTLGGMWVDTLPVGGGRRPETVYR